MLSDVDFFLSGYCVGQIHMDQTQLASGEFPLCFVPFLGFFEPMYSFLPWTHPLHPRVIKQPLVCHWGAWASLVLFQLLIVLPLWFLVNVYNMEDI